MPATTPIIYEDSLFESQDLFASPFKQQHQKVDTVATKNEIGLELNLGLPEMQKASETVSTPVYWSRFSAPIWMESMILIILQCLMNWI